MIGRFFKGIWNFFNGWKTRMIMLAGAVLQLMSLLDAQLVSSAFKLDGAGAAQVTLLLFVLGWLAREVANRPGIIAKMLESPD